MTSALRGAAMLVIVAAGLAGGQASTPRLPASDDSPAARFASALTYEQFTAGDTARRAEWERNYGQAAAAVADLGAEWRTLSGKWHLLVVAESWCGDAVNSVPFLARLAAEQPVIELRVLRKADAGDLLQAHPLDGQTATPLVLVYDDAFVERGAWIERPAALRALVKAKQNRTCEDALNAEVGSWRAKDGGRSVLREVLALMRRQPAATDHAHTQQQPR